MRKTILIIISIYLIIGIAISLGIGWALNFEDIDKVGAIKTIFIWPYYFNPIDFIRLVFS